MAVNFLRLASNTVPDPAYDSRQSESEPLPSKSRHPWIGVEVMVSKQGHPRKGEVGRIVEVLPAITSNANTRIVVMTSSYNPHVPFVKFATEYTDVVSYQYDATQAKL